MKKLLLISLLFSGISSYAQRADGFFAFEFSFIDPLLLKELQVDKFEIEFFSNNRKTGWVEIYLDSNQQMIKRISEYGGTVNTSLYAATNITQFACPVEKPSYIKNCEGGRITATDNAGAYRKTVFDSNGRVLEDRFKPRPAALEIKRKFIYQGNDLLDSILVEDIKTDGSIDKKELYLFQYNNDERLIAVKQLIEYSTGYREEGSFTYKYFNSGLVKTTEGNTYLGQYSMKTGFKFYSKGVLLK